MASFDIGNIITGSLEGRTTQAIILDKAEDSDQLLLMTLTEGEIFEAVGANVADWKKSPTPDARWVEVYDAESETPFFAAYLPNFTAAVAVFRAFEAREGDFRVEIYTTEDSENDTLDSMGYFGNGADPD
ncbi:MAG TPA: hypothetical protein VGM26_09910 [Rhizomicrobium sp.]|jgi:hypothetical protein